MRCFSEYKMSNSEELFIDVNVQNILQKITGFDIDKVFQRRDTGIKNPVYKLLTDKQLNDYRTRSLLQSKRQFQMPPFKEAWKELDGKSVILTEGENISQFENGDHKYLFIDISYGLPRRERSMVVRELNGNLRLADNKEQDRILQLFFPIKGKMYNIPKMFEQHGLEHLLAQMKYEYILDRACVQFEPDDPNYVQVTHHTYDKIHRMGHFDMLRSTRFFGPMVFYFVLEKKIDSLLIYMLQSGRLSDAADVVRLYNFIHLGISIKTQQIHKQLIENYLRSRTTDDTTRLETALRDCLNTETLSNSL